MAAPFETSPSLSDDICESGAVASAQVAAEQTANLSNALFANLIHTINISQQNAVAHQQAMNQLSLAITGKLANLIANLSPLQAAAVATMAPSAMPPSSAPPERPNTTREA
jgi:hypothetical protein